METSILELMDSKKVVSLRNLFEKNRINSYALSNEKYEDFQKRMDKIVGMDSKKIIQFFTILFSLPVESKLSINDILSYNEEIRVENRFNFKKIRSYGNINSLIKHRVYDEIGKLSLIKKNLTFYDDKIYFPMLNSKLISKGIIFYFRKLKNKKIIYLYNLSDKNRKLSLSELYEEKSFRDWISGKIYTKFPFIIEAYGSLWLS